MDFATMAGQGGVLGDGPILVVAARHALALKRAVEATSRAVVLTGHDTAVARFEALAPAVALVDLRGASLDAGVALVGALAPGADARSAALVALVRRGDERAYRQAHDAGATHLLESGSGPGALAAVLRSAERHARRLRARGDPGARAAAAIVGGARWEWRRGASDAAISPALALMLGEPADRGRLLVARGFAHLDPLDREDFARALARLARGAVSGEISHRMMIDGRQRTIAHHVRAHRDGQGKLTRLTATVEDLDAVDGERRVSARFDLLTGLVNGAYARDWIDGLLGGAVDYDPACIVLMLSITRFDGINAAYGRRIADALLQAVARRLRRVVGADRQESRLFARVGGAEFIVAFAGPVRLGEVTVAATRMSDAFETPFDVEGRAVHLGCRIGVALADSATASADVLLRRASAALARAKGGERGGFEVLGGLEPEDPMTSAASLGDDLRAAIAADAFELVYQPIVDLARDRIVGVEALIRWRHDGLGLLPAETLIQVAERAEVGPQLSEHILRKALKETCGWPDALRDLRVAINATAEDLMTPDFAERVLFACAATGFPPARLTIEATETGVMRDIARAQRAMLILRTAGVGIAIDDFGSGYSGLAYLAQLPANYLKLDRSLVGNLFASESDRIVVTGLVDIARRLRIGVIAEGVETGEQRDAVTAAGCGYYQGYLCSRPVAGAALAELVLGWNARAP